MFWLFRSIQICTRNSHDLAIRKVSSTVQSELRKLRKNLDPLKHPSDQSPCNYHSLLQSPCLIDCLNIGKVVSSVFITLFVWMSFLIFIAMEFHCSNLHRGKISQKHYR